MILRDVLYSWRLFLRFIFPTRGSCMYAGFFPVLLPRTSAILRFSGGTLLMASCGKC